MKKLPIIVGEEVINPKILDSYAHHFPETFLKEGELIGYDRKKELISEEGFFTLLPNYGNIKKGE